VDHFDHGGERVMLGSHSADGLSGEEEQGRAESFAADAERVLGQFVDERVGVAQFLLQTTVDERQVRRDRREQPA
jgi:hypothetical protein